MERRAAQMDAAYAALGRTSSDFWARRMTNRGSQLLRPAGDGDVLMQCIDPFIDRQTTVLDVGAGAGRYALPLAARVHTVTAVEPDATMTDLLAAAISEAAIPNVSIVRERWPSVRVVAADLVICAHVLYPIADVVPFLEQLNASARRAVFVAMRAVTPETPPLAAIWRDFHGDERCLQPGYVELFDVLYEMGIYANVRTVTGSGQSWSYESIDEAVAGVREHVIAAETRDNDAIIREALELSLVHEDGASHLPSPPAHLGVLWWETSG